MHAAPVREDDGAPHLVRDVASSLGTFDIENARGRCERGRGEPSLFLHRALQSIGTASRRAHRNEQMIPSLRLEQKQNEAEQTKSVIKAPTGRGGREQERK